MTDKPSIRDMLAELYTPAEIDVWLTSPHPLLGGATAADIIAAGREDEVRAVIKQLLDCDLKGDMDMTDDRESAAEFAQRMWALLVGPDSKTKDSEVADFSRLIALARRGTALHPQDDTILIDGTPFSRRWLAEQVGKLERDAALKEAAKAMVSALDELVAASGGVYGLHLNGDHAPWDEICEGGRFEAWLAPLETLRSATRACISPPPPSAFRATVDAKPAPPGSSPTGAVDAVGIVERSWACKLEQRFFDACARTGIQAVPHDEVSGLDFYLPELDIYIEIKRFHSSRIERQMAKRENVIAVQGEVAVNALCKIIAKGGFNDDIRLEIR